MLYTTFTIYFLWVSFGTIPGGMATQAKRTAGPPFIFLRAVRAWRGLSHFSVINRHKLNYMLN